MKTSRIWSPTGNVAGPIKTIGYLVPPRFQMFNDQKVRCKRTNLLHSLSLIRSTNHQAANTASYLFGWCFGGLIDLAMTVHVLIDAGTRSNKAHSTKCVCCIAKTHRGTIKASHLPESRLGVLALISATLEARAR